MPDVLVKTWKLKRQSKQNWFASKLKSLLIKKIRKTQEDEKIKIKTKIEMQNYYYKLLLLSLNKKGRNEHKNLGITEQIIIIFSNIHY